MGKRKAGDVSEVKREHRVIRMEVAGSIVEGGLHLMGISDKNLWKH